MSTQSEKADAIVEYFKKYPDVPYKELARIYSTTPTQVKRVLRRSGLYINREYLEAVKEILDVPVNEAVFYRGNHRQGTVVKRVMVAADIHIPYHDPDAVAVFMHYAKEYQPDEIYLLGDLVDFYQISKYDKIPPSGVSPSTELNLVYQFFKELREFVPLSVPIFWLQGNHEERLMIYAAKMAPKLWETNFWNIPDLMDFLGFPLDDINVMFVDPKEWKQTHGKPFSIGDKIYLMHGHEIRAGGLYVAKNVFTRALENVMFGHVHRTDEWICKTCSGGIKGAWSIGSLCDLTPRFATENRWNNGFACVDFGDDGYFTVYNYRIYDGRLI